MLTTIVAWYRNIDINQQISQVLNNDVLIGFLALSVIGFVAYFLKRILSALFKLIRSRVVYEYTITNKDHVFNYVLKAFKTLGMVEKLRRVRIGGYEGNYAYDSEELTYPGDGIHLLFYKGSPMLVSKTTGESKTKEPPETFVFYVLFWNRKMVHNLIADGRQAKKSENKNKIDLITPFSNRCRQTYKNKRFLDSVFIDGQVKNEILDSVNWFIHSEKWFIDCGIPYHMGIMLYGPPGTGKTSLIKALATHYEKTLAVVNLATIKSDFQLKETFDQIPSGCIVVLEDIDSCPVVKPRNKALETHLVDTHKETEDKAVAENGQNNSLTLGGLLNVLDGLDSKDGQITVFTTNNLLELDAALMRPGRVDERFYIGPPKPEVVYAMIDHLAPEFDEQDRQAIVEQTDGLAQAHIQSAIRQRKAEQRKKAKVGTA